MNASIITVVTSDGKYKQKFIQGNITKPHKLIALAKQNGFAEDGDRILTTMVTPQLIRQIIQAYERTTVPPELPKPRKRRKIVSKKAVS